MLWVKRIFFGYILAVVAAFVLAALVYHKVDPALGLQMQDIAKGIAILPFQLLAWIIGWFSNTPEMIDATGGDYAINNIVTIAVVILAVVLIIKKLFKPAWGAMFGSGGARAHH